VGRDAPAGDGRAGLETAMVAHFAMDVVLHTVMPLLDV
jgi:hypothetical protein